MQGRKNASRKNHLTTMAPAAVLAASAAPAGRTLELINGDRLLVRTGPTGRPLVSVRSAAGYLASLVTITTCGVISDAPLAAMPYLGQGLDPTLFRLSDLQRAERDGRLPVSISYLGRLRAIPGITVTRAGRGLAAGYLTARSARLFGAALDRQFRADHASGSYGARGLFADGLSIALSGSAGFRLHTLTVTAAALNGKPDNGDSVLVFNADNCGTFSDPIESENAFYHGVARFSVPDGHYWAIGQFINFSPKGLALRMPILPQFTVGANTAVHMSERAASSEVSVATPRPAITQSVSLAVVRTTPQSQLSISWTAAGLSLWVSPVAVRPAVGTLQAFTSAQLTSPPGPGIPYVYNLDFVDPPDMIPAQHYIASAGLPGGNASYPCATSGSARRAGCPIGQ